MYEGNKLNCKSCEFVSNFKIIKGIKKYSACKNIDHDKIKLYRRIFSGYEDSLNSCCICKYYKPKKYIKNSKFKNIEEYIEFLDLELYQTSEYYKIKGLNTLKHFKSIAVIIDNLWIDIPMYDWINDTWKTDNKIKYIRLFEIKINSDGKFIKKIRKDNLEIGSFGFLELEVL